MATRPTGPALGAILALYLAAFSPAHAAPPICQPSLTADLPSPRAFTFAGSDDNHVYSFRRQPPLKFLFVPASIQYPFATRDTYGFELTFVVGPDGKVTCASIKPADEAIAPELNDQRRAYLDSLADWGFEPYQRDGKAVAIVETLQISEEELPQTHIAMPAGDPKLVTITQDMRPYMSSYGAYHVELHGDGAAIYTSLQPDDPLGPQTYHVDPAGVQAVLTAAEAADFWSLRDRYRLPPNPTEQLGDFERINITIGGVTKSLTDDFSDDAGLSQKALRLQVQTLAAAHIDFWQSPTLATLDQLKTNGFDFTSPSAGRLLLHMVQNRSVKDDAVLALLQLGAPRDAAERNSYTDEDQSLLEAALGTGRLAITAQLIKDGALLNDGKPNPYAVNAAFAQAIRSGKWAAVEQILPYKPDMTYADDDDPDVKISIIRKLDNPLSDTGDRIDMAQHLLDLGADINAKAYDGTTLLHTARFDLPFTQFLLDHGAIIDVLDNQGSTPLATAMEEDVALLLLTRDANPRLSKAAEQLRFNIKYNNWLDAKVWLNAHGYADVLIPQSGDH